MSFKYEDLNQALFDKVVAFSYSIGSGLGGPGEMVMLTKDGKEYVIGQEGFEGQWIYPENTFSFIAEAFDSKKDNTWFRMSTKYASNRIYCRKEFKNEIERLKKMDWKSKVWKVLGIDDVDHVVYDKTKEIREEKNLEIKRAEEHFNNVLLKPDSFEWRKLYNNNCIPKDKKSYLDFLRGYYLLLFKQVDASRIDGVMMKIVFQKERFEEGVEWADAKIEAYNLFYTHFEDVKGPLEIPAYQDISLAEDLFSEKLSCYSVNEKGEFIRSYPTLEKAKKGAMFWLKVWGGIDKENVIPYGTIRTDTKEVHNRQIHEAKLRMLFIDRYEDVIETIKKYDFPGNAAGEVAEILGITLDEVKFLYSLFDSTLFTASRLQSIKTMLNE